MKLCVCYDETKAANLLDALLKTTNESPCELKNLVLMKSQSAEKLKQLKYKYIGFTICTMDEVREAGRQKPLPYQFPNDDGIYVINFTSGSTGLPKGVIITCGMFKFNCRAYCGYHLRDMNHFNKEDLYFSFLPLAHVMEQMAMFTCLMNGVKVAFFSGDITKLIEEITLAKPTLLAIVPRLLIRIYDGAMEKFSAAKIPKFLVKRAITSKLQSTKNSNEPIRGTFWDKVFFGRLQNTLGGRLRFALTGGSACPKDVLDFARASFGAIIYQGYGSTETGGAVCLTMSNDNDASHTGPVIAGAQIKLGDVPDMDLFPSRDPKLQRGEVLVKSPGCTRGYYKAPDKTRELFDSEGWLKTGDVGEWDEFGNLKIVDRCKNLFKLSQGEYVAPEKVEGVYATCPLVVQSFLDGRSESSYAIALVHPNLERLAARIGNPGATIEAICNNQEATKLVLNELDTLGRSKGLSGFELAKKIKLIAEPFTVENALLTATLKPVRAKIREHFAREIDALYASS
ncbi:Long-chain-fatty-acid--CoA ligase 6 [Cichlidogyrus casuarinus]|uniref:long-chain-fatty-acid--CoA ligase n=1 Tax=Cichlidogyrus casuarinus TaxID=1844966 RepID=A0ABD2PPR0_9PLAT